MFESIKIRKAAKEFQRKYNLSDSEMSYIVFSKVPFLNNNYVGYLNPNVHKPQIYRKIEKLNNILEKKLSQAEAKFAELTTKFHKETVFNACKDAYYEDLVDFLYNFQYNSSKVRLTYPKGTSTETMQKVWDKADSYLDAICFYYVFSIGDEFVEFSKYAELYLIRTILTKNEIDCSKDYQEIRTFLIDKCKALSVLGDRLANDWYSASIIKI